MGILGAALRTGFTEITRRMATLVSLRNGQKMPQLGLGTYLALKGECEDATKYAIDIGYRHLDTAFSYNNENEVGKAINAKIAEGVVKREDIFLVTKLSAIHHDPEHVERACRMSLRNLGLDYIDLYLMHTPFGMEFHGDEDTAPKNSAGEMLFSNTDYLDTWRAMEPLVEKGLVRSIGVSNFSSHQLTRLLANCSVKPVANQVECNPGINQAPLRTYCAKNDIALIAFSPLGRPHYAAKDPKFPKPALLDDRVIAMAKKYGKTPGQIVLRFLVQLGTTPVPKSSNKERMKDNLEIFDFELSPEDLCVMQSFNTGERTCPFTAFTTHKYFPFHEEF
ncbi:aldo-keto reductase family 1 member B1-like [Phlebotomus argentipes]|uniref:aldo-keto reductase family 1 member B1-like n=1 Tax=Phlebotomus argentipes TaxID=94469 RepID=UPI0028936D3F|nr:aldo-keto reductase family 1 member B1-like [Phlebotomus argentipes]